MSHNKIKIGITQGDLNGIGYEIILRALEDARILELMTPVIYGSGRAATFYRKACNLAQMQLNTIEHADDSADAAINIINVIPEDFKIEPGVASKQAGVAAFNALERAVTDLREGTIDALVTAPINKDNIQSETFTFPGHTEYLEASLAEGPSSKALMILFNEHLKVALATVHTPLARVADAITREALVEKLTLFNNALHQDFGITTPRIAVLALNPHAGENGLLGTEEQQQIIPAIQEAQAAHIECYGPYAADGFFGSGAWKNFDGVLAMYHDQGLTPLKLLDMDSGVNFTAGLPAVRTSPDHGTAYDIAGKGVASEQSMRQAIYSAIDIVRHRRNHAEATANPLKKQQVERRRSKGNQQPAAADAPTAETSNPTDTNKQ